ncbi:MAG: YidC/Oxa1 family membrane protein insertase [Candidatus Eremiobacteraeota bacterium]|nr:YidC/Oxa1 family membrane protein insertase [Candidatus Eremiobacteraeota bacterium]
MEFPFAALLAFNPIDPIVNVLHAVLQSIFGVVHNYGWSLIILAGAVKLAFWPLNTMQFKAMLKTQQIAPKLKALQAKYKNDKEKLNAETMALYKETGANPLAGCAPLLLQMPILISLYWAVISDKDRFASQSWLWIGSAFSKATPIFQGAVNPPAADAHPAYHLLAANLAVPDLFLLSAYVISMYFSVRFTSPAVDPAQAQQQKIMAFISPAMVGYLGFRYAWPSALIIYWLSFNVFTMAQQLYLINKYHKNPSPVGPHPEAIAAEDTKRTGKSPALGSSAKASLAANGAATSALPASGGGSRAARRRRSSRR